MKAKIEKVATDLFIRHGLKGTSYDMIAKKLDITTANIHYHFGSKSNLVSIIVKNYVESTLNEHRKIWDANDKTLFQKIQLIKKFNFIRYSKYNKGVNGGLPWSLIGRMRLEADLLPEVATKSLERFSIELRRFIDSAVRKAITNGDLQETAPKEELTILITGIVYGSAVFTQMSGGFKGLEDMYRAISETIESTYGARVSI